MPPALRRFASSVLSFTYALQVTGCTAWHAKQEAPGAVIAQYPQKQVRLRLVDSSKVELRRVWTLSDTVFGYRRPTKADPPEAIVTFDSVTGVRVAVPFADINSVEVREVDAGRTTGMVILGLGVTALAVGAAVAASNFEPMGGLGSSCPLVYSWDGRDWHLDSGTFAGAIMPALQHTDLDVLSWATPIRDTLRLRVTGRSGETEFLDELTFLAADHPAGTTVAPDGRANGELHTLQRIEAPAAAQDFDGRDVGRALAREDGSYWESALDRRSPDDVRDGVELTFRRPPDARALKLVIDGQNTPWAGFLVRRLVLATGRNVLAWYDPGRTDSAAKGLAPALAVEASLAVMLWQGGAWRPVGRFWEVGPELAKRQVLPIDLAGVTGDTVRLRLESAPSFWLLDRVGVDFSRDAGVTLTTLPISRMTMDGAFEPAGLVRSTDQEYLTIEPTQAGELQVVVPSPRTGMARTFLVRSSGWYRVHGDEHRPPEESLLAHLQAAGAWPASRTAVLLMNEALAAASPGQ